MATQQEQYGMVANYNLSPGTRADGQSSALEVDNKGNLLVNLNASSGGTISTKTALTPSSPTFATVGVTSASAVSSNTSRKGLTLVNTSANYISIAFGATAVLNSGITLTPYGTFNMDEYSFCTSAVNAIASSASSNLAIQEWTT